MASIMTVVQNFPPSYRGKVIGMLETCFSGGPALMALVYGLCFVDGHQTEEDKQNLGGFYLTSAIAFIVVNSLAVVFFGIPPSQKDEIEYDVRMLKAEARFVWFGLLVWSGLAWFDWV